MAGETLREAVGVFHDVASLQAAADELMTAGFDRADLSMLAGHRTVERELGHMYEKVQDLEDDPQVAVQAYVGTDSLTEAKGAAVGGLAYVGAVAAAGMIVATGGTMAALIAGAAAAGGAGGVVGAMLARVLGQQRARYLQQQLDRGGLLLWVRVNDASHEARAVEILTRHSAEDVHVHDLPGPAAASAGGVSYDMSFMKRLGL